MLTYTYEQWLLGSLGLAAILPLLFPKDFLRGLFSGFFVSLLLRGFAFLYTHQTSPPELQNTLEAVLRYAAIQARDPFLCALGTAVVVGGARKMWLRRHPEIGLIKVLYFKDYLIRFIFLAFGTVPAALALILGPPLLGSTVLTTVKEYYLSIKSQTLTKEIQEWTTSMRPQLPLRADEKEVLQAVTIQNHTVVLSYTLTSLPNKGEVSQVLNERQENALQTMCKKPSMLKIAESGGIFLFKYQDANGGNVGEFSISKASCK